MLDALIVWNKKKLSLLLLSQLGGSASSAPES